MPGRVVTRVVLAGVLLAAAVLGGSPGGPTVAEAAVPQTFAEYVGLPGDQVVMIPDGTYPGGGLVSRAHPATTGPYKGWLLLVAENPGGVVVDLAASPLVLGPKTTRVLIAGVRFVNGPLRIEGKTIVFWQTDHSYPANVWAGQSNRPSTPVAIDADATTTYDIRFLGADIHDSGVGIEMSNSRKVQLFGTKIWNISKGSTTVNPDAISGLDGGSRYFRVEESWIRGRVQLSDTLRANNRGGDHLSARFVKSWFSDSPGPGFTFKSSATTDPRGVYGSRTKVKSFRHASGDRRDIVGTKTVAANSSPLVQVADTSITTGTPPAAELSPADVWRSTRPYERWWTALPALKLRPPTTPLGFYSGSPNSDGIQEFLENEAWLGRRVDYFTAYGEGASATGFNANAYGQFRSDRLGQWAAKSQTPPFQLVYTVPLAFGDRYNGEAAVASLIEEQWDALINNTTVRSTHPTAAGLNRRFYQDFADQLVRARFGTAIIRLASEHDIEGSRWSSRVDPAKFKAAFRVVVDVMRARAPGLRFDFTSIGLNFGTGPAPGNLVTDAYPGDAYVDFIGIDQYDQGQGVPADIGVPDGRKCGWRDPAAVFDTLVLPRLETARRWAAARGKPLSVPEWGLSGGGTELAGACGGDDPVYVVSMAQWLRGLPASGAGALGYHSYFEGNPPHDGPHALDFFPNAANAFHAEFGG